MRQFIIAKKKKPLARDERGKNAPAGPPVRTFVLPAGESPVVVVDDPEPPRAGEARPSARHESAPVAMARPLDAATAGAAPTKRARRKTRQRDFVVAYQGKFLGHYRSRRAIAPRVAFAIVARELRKRSGGFAPEHLELYRPTRLSVRNRTGAANTPDDGEFNWFAPLAAAGNAAAQRPAPMAPKNGPNPAGEP